MNEESGSVALYAHKRLDKKHFIIYIFNLLLTDLLYGILLDVSEFRTKRPNSIRSRSQDIS